MSDVRFLVVTDAGSTGESFRRVSRYLYGRSYHLDSNRRWDPERYPSGLYVTDHLILVAAMEEEHAARGTQHQADRLRSGGMAVREFESYGDAVRAMRA